MDKVTDVLIRVDLFFIIWNWDVLWFGFINPLLPYLLISVDSVWKFFEEHRVLVTELVLGESLQVQPDFLLHPRGEWIVSVIDTTTSFEEETYISRCEFVILDQDLGGHQEFESNLISFEQSSVDVSIDSSVHPYNDVVNSLLWKWSLRRLINTVIVKI
jgi:hypothetical protein